MPETLSLFDEAPPPVAEPKRRPRFYQLEALNAWDAQRVTARGHMIVLFCGGGKTFLAGRIAGKEPGRVLFLINRDKLARQSLAKLPEDSGRRWQLEQAASYADTGGTSCVVATVQSLKDKRLERFSPDAFSLIIVDEVHMMMGKSYRKPLEYFSGAKLLGITATPDRKAKKRKDGTEGAVPGYRGMFDNVVYRKTLVDAIDEGWSTPLDMRTYLSKVDLASVKWDSKTGDFQAGALDEAIVEAVAPVKEACFTKCDDLRTVVFCPGVKSAIAVADALNLERPGCARVVYGDQDNVEGLGTKERNIAAHGRGEFQFLVNCMILTVGYDDERLQCIVDAAPTASRALAEQKFGRPARLWPGIGDIADQEARHAAIAASPKPTARVVDLAFNSTHELVTPLEILGPHYTAQERKLARAKAEKEGGSVVKALAAAREELNARRARAAAAATARASLTEVKKQPKPEGRKNAAGEFMLTPPQERRMAEFGIPFDPSLITKAQANMILGTEFGRLKGGQCSDKQINWLTTVAGVKCKVCSLKRGQLIAEIYKKVRRPLNAHEILQTTKKKWGTE